MKDIPTEGDGEKMQKEELKVEENEEGLSNKWKMFNVIMCGFAFMLVFTGKGMKNTHFLEKISKYL